MEGKVLVAVFMGSDSDLPVMKGAVDVLAELGIRAEVHISSAHRTPERTAELVREAEAKGVEVIIAGAGMAAHLPGVIAAFTVLPVIGVPISSGSLQGVDALYAIAQMPPGVPVATVAINGARNAGILAAQILSGRYPEIRGKLRQMREKMAQGIVEKDRLLQEKGIEGFMAK